mmetsp:Transcript_6159/g.10704  ORF Transcript_6159/g.10704 Transcript_6159/m.10704 type:complete len:206 (+) Transcript_6159:33-650(+)
MGGCASSDCPGADVGHNARSTREQAHDGEYPPLWVNGADPLFSMAGANAKEASPGISPNTPCRAEEVELPAVFKLKLRPSEQLGFYFMDDSPQSTSIGQPSPPSSVSSISAPGKDLLESQDQFEQAHLSECTDGTSRGQTSSNWEQQLLVATDPYCSYEIHVDWELKKERRSSRRSSRQRAFGREADLSPTAIAPKGWRIMATAA